MMLHIVVRFRDYEDMLEDTSLEFPRRPDMPDDMYFGVSGGLNTWENYPVFPTRLKKDDNLSLADAVVSSILSTGNLLSSANHYYSDGLTLSLL